MVTGTQAVTISGVADINQGNVGSVIDNDNSGGLILSLNAIVGNLANDISFTGAEDILVSGIFLMALIPL